MGIIIRHPSELGPVQLCEDGGFDIAEMYYAESGKIYYMSLPKKFFSTMIMRYSLSNFLLCFLSCRYWFPWLVPIFVVMFFKMNIFINWCRTINFSRRKMWTFFILEIILFQIAGLLLRALLIKLWI